MGILQEVFNIFTESLKANERMVHIASELKHIQNRVHKMNARLIRVEVWLELAEKQQQIYKYNRHLDQIPP